MVLASYAIMAVTGSAVGECLVLTGTLMIQTLAFCFITLMILMFHKVQVCLIVFEWCHRLMLRRPLALSVS